MSNSINQFFQSVKKLLQRGILSFAIGIFKLIPFWLLYRLSDLIFLILYYVVRLRRKVVRKNLRFAFPNHSAAQINRIEKDSYRNFCDIALEAAKGYSLSPAQMAKRYKINNIPLFDHYFNQNRSIIGFVAHFANWEWGISLQQHIKHKAVYIYKKLHNRMLDDFVREKRKIYGAQLVHKEQVARVLLKNRHKLCMYALIADQRPSGDQEKHFVSFLGHENVPCFSGPEMIAKTFDYPVFYCVVKRIKRGFYDIHPVLITDKPKEMPAQEITQRCMSALEAQILENPANWMWLHKRFKDMQCK